MRLFGLFGGKTKIATEAVGIDVATLPPGEICAQAQRLISFGDLDRAYEVLRTGISAHPESQEIRTLFEQLDRHHRRAQIANLNAMLQTSPNPATYVRLVDAYLADGDRIAARQICTEGIERHPDEPDLFLRMGRIWFDLFLEGAIGKNAHLAINNLGRCLARDPENRDAREMLVQLYCLIGARSRALREFGWLLPGRELRSLYQDVVGGIDLRDDDLEALLRQFERKRAPGSTESLTSLRTVEEKRPNERILKDILNGLASTRGHLATAVVDSNGAIVESAIDSSSDLDRDALAEIVKALSEVAKSCCARMDIGTFEEEQIQGLGRTAFVKALGDLTMLVMVDKKARPHEIAGHLARLSAAQ